LKSNLLYVILTAEYSLKDKINNVISFCIMLDIMHWRGYCML